MITVKVANIIGFAIQPNIRDEQSKEIFPALPPRSRIAFIDLAPTDDIAEFVSQLEKSGHEIVCYADHHLDEKREAEIRNAGIIMSKLNNRAKITTRSQARSCYGLVDFMEWSRKGVNAVFFHADFDGFSSFLKGCGAAYQEMKDDAEIMDGYGNGRRLSLLGKLFANAHELLVPAYSYDPVGYENTRARVYRIFADWVMNNLKKEDAQKFVIEVREATDKAEKLARRLSLEAELLPGGIVFGNFLPYAKAGKNIAIALWKQLVYKRFGPALICTIGVGHLGEQIYIEVPKVWVDKIDIRDYVPEGTEKRTSFKAQITLDQWENFLAIWQGRGQVKKINIKSIGGNENLILGRT